MMALVVMVLGCHDRGPTGPSFPGAGLYFPLAAGNVWEYDFTTNSSGFDTTYLKVVILDSGSIIDNLRWYSTIDICPERLRSTPLWCGMFAHQGNKTLARRTGRIYLEPETILDLPLAIGKQWVNEDWDTAYALPGGHQVYESRLSKRYVRGWERVMVGAGTFNCYRVEDSTRYFYRYVSPTGDTSSSSYQEHANEWFAQGIGLVKQITNYNWNNDYGYREIYALRSYNVRLTE